MGKSRRHILLLEENKDVRCAFKALFENVYGYGVEITTGIVQAAALVARQHFDVAVIDLSCGAGVAARLGVIEEWRTVGEAFPIIATSAHDHEGLGVEALNAGADDYIRKPFRFGELAARISRLVNRDLAAVGKSKADGIALPNTRFMFAGAYIDVDLRISFPNGTATDLSPKHVGILLELLRHAGSLITREQLIHAVWGRDANPNSKSLDQYLYVLRKMFRLGGIELGDFIVPATRVGWRVSGRIIDLAPTK